MGDILKSRCLPLDHRCSTGTGNVCGSPAEEHHSAAAHSSPCHAWPAWAVSWHPWYEAGQLTSLQHIWAVRCKCNRVQVSSRCKQTSPAWCGCQHQSSGCLCALDGLNWGEESIWLDRLRQWPSRRSCSCQSAAPQLAHTGTAVVQWQRREPPPQSVVSAVRRTDTPTSSGEKMLDRSPLTNKTSYPPFLTAIPPSYLQDSRCVSNVIKLCHVSLLANQLLPANNNGVLLLTLKLSQKYWW